MEHTSGLRAHGIEWITRDSAADSLVCYCLGEHVGETVVTCGLVAEPRIHHQI
jgi:hypothetical protein